MKLTDKKRENIIEAAIAEFKEKGFREAKTTSIAKKANVSSRTLYKHFESKDILFQTVTEILIKKKSTWSSVSYNPNISFELQLMDTMKEYISSFKDAETLMLSRMINSEMLRDLNQSRVFYPKLATYDYPVTRLIAEAMEAGILRKADPEYATNQLFALIRGIFFWPAVLLGQVEENNETLQDCINMFLSYYQPNQSSQTLNN